MSYDWSVVPNHCSDWLISVRLSDEVRTLQTQLERKSGAVQPDTLLALLQAAAQVEIIH